MIECGMRIKVDATLPSLTLTERDSQTHRANWYIIYHYKYTLYYTSPRLHLKRLTLPLASFQHQSIDPPSHPLSILTKSQMLNRGKGPSVMSA